MERDQNRRTFLRLSSIAAIGAIAGCSAPDAGGGDGTDGGTTDPAGSGGTTDPAGSGGTTTGGTPTDAADGPDGAVPGSGRR
ncbi:hypothetical protein BRD00_04935 [Halobacteriales archaeon QS_8_69_26]|nr:MAG: hypothetical protein BRD00_04935 [Halobacteriales archaeon QS_8_69_26]